MSNFVHKFGGREVGKTAAAYSDMIESKSYPSDVNSFQQYEIDKLWSAGSRMQAIQNLQQILEGNKSKRTLL